MADTKTATPPGIAVIGMSGRFPGAPGLTRFWENVANGVEVTTFFRDEELLAAGVDPEVLKNPRYVKAQSALEDIDLFDAPFFGFSPREAEITDPQIRLLLECGWHALENAGYHAGGFNGQIGAFVGVSTSHYFLNNLLPQRDLIRTMGIFPIMHANDRDFAATMLSYKLNLTGPSVNVSTACSTSLVAIHLARLSLLTHQCDMALAGGASVFVPQKTGYLYTPGGIHSPDGRCRAFDAEARGTVAGSGVGLVVMRRLEDALADGDSILAIIRGSAINNDGSRKIGFTAPSVQGQRAVIAESMAVAGVEPEAIGYVEAHGTGTVMGDPIEMTALKEAFRARPDAKWRCAVGSLKTNMGHLDAAAGVAGFIKTVLALKNKQIPPSLHYRRGNPEIDFENSPFYVNTRLREWEAREGQPRLAGVSSFGIGGTNAHATLAEAPAPIIPAPPANPWQLVVVSAKTPRALSHAAERLARFLDDRPDAALADVAFTLQCGREPHEFRRFVVCRESSAAVAALRDDQTARKQSERGPGNPPSICLMFPGQGVQRIDMARALYGHEPVFREELTRCAEILHCCLDEDLISVIYPEGNDRETAAARLRETRLAQPATFAVEFALASLWASWGITPDAMIGHSVGELVAACLAGVFNLEDGLKLVAARARLMQTPPPGAMLSAPLGESELRPLLGDHLCLAAINGPRRLVAAGPIPAVADLEFRLAEQGVRTQRLETSHAFHSQMMDPILDDFRRELDQVELRPPKIPFISNVTGTWILPEQAVSPDYWVRHLRSPVQFAAGIETLIADKPRLFIEAGPGQSLSMLIRQPNRDIGAVVPSLPRSGGEDRELPTLMTALGSAWLAGAAIDWEWVHGDAPRRRVPLPGYPFERQRYWTQPSRDSIEAREDQPQVTHRRLDFDSWFFEPTWKRAAPACRAARTNSAGARLWLIFADGGGLADVMADRLARLEQPVYTVTSGAAFSDKGGGRFTLPPVDEESYMRLIESLPLFEEEVRDNCIEILHCWSLGQDAAGQQPEAEFNQIQERGLYSLALLARALVKQNVAQRVRISVIADGLFSVTGEETMAPAKATLLGVAHTIPQEIRNIRFKTVDVVPPQGCSAALASLAARLIDETDARDAVAVAFRGPYRWVQAFESAAFTAAPRTRLKPEGVYLITGGLGRIGMTLATRLGCTKRARLILTRRSFFPQRKNWDEWLEAHDTSNPISVAIRRLREIEVAGGEALVVQADAADAGAMAAAFSLAESKFGRIDGVFHAAGGVQGQSLRLVQDAEIGEFEAQFQAKVQGLLVLERLLRERSVDFCALFSSLATVLGGIGHGAYACANHFMDAFVDDRERDGKGFWLAIDWDGWREQDPAPGQSGGELSGLGSSVANLSLSHSEGMAALECILDQRLARTVVSTGDLKSRIARWISFDHGPKTPSDQTRSLHERPSLERDYVAPRDEIEETIAAIWQELLGIDKIGVHDDFFTLGGDSLLGTQLLSRLREAFQVELSLEKMFDDATVANLACEVFDSTLRLSDREALDQALAEIALERDTENRPPENRSLAQWEGT